MTALLISCDVAGRKVRKVETETPAGDDLRAEYQRRFNERRGARERWSRLEQHVADTRLVVFSAGLMLAFFVYRTHWPSALWLIVPLVVFVALVVVHEPLRRGSGRAGRAMDFYAKGLARMEDRWAGTGVSGLGFLDLNHPYAADLDLFGAGSLFERLCTARTRAGEDALASWLLAPALPETLTERHEAITELRPRLDLREDLELLGSDVRSGIDPEALAAWGKAPRVFPGSGLRIAAAILALSGAAVAIGWACFESGVIPLLVTLAIEIAFALWLAERVRRVLAAVDERAHDLVLLGDLLDRLEREPSQSALLRRLSVSLETHGRPASVQIRRLARLVQFLDARKNQFFFPVAAVLLWKTRLAMAVDAWRGAEGPAIAGWLRAVGEFEALCALAAYAAENPSDPFPEIVTSGARFEAEGLGHPLIPAAECVRNDLSLGGSVRALVVSGSNMSGKSTLLRTAGVAAVMALAGAPVRAVRLRVSPLAVGATLRVQDSLLAGKSRFYAEITRVRQLVDLAGGPLPLLFLFDELFHGTNSHDRRIGAESVLRGLLDRGAIGLITTHDLALAKIAAGIGPLALNVHFEDHFEDGQMRFDYRMRPGVVEHSNALALMRAVGLEV
ncbi:MAG: MutS-related protein [Isosphaeraceae bacterium]